MSNSQVQDLPADEAAPTIDTTPRQPTIVIEPAHGWLRTNWAEWWAFRDLLYILAWRSMKVRYKQAVLGGLWAILQPLIAATIFAIVFGRILRVQPENVPPFLFAYSVNLSKGGMFLETANVAPVGSEVALVFHVADRGTFEIKGPPPQISKSARTMARITVGPIP